jgi:hypothetical protein
VTDTRCRIGTVISPDDGHIVAGNMLRKAINILFFPTNAHFIKNIKCYSFCITQLLHVSVLIDHPQEALIRTLLKLLFL